MEMELEVAKVMEMELEAAKMMGLEATNQMKMEAAREKLERGVKMNGT